MLAVSGEEAHHTRLVRARAMSRWLWSVQALNKDTVPAKGALCQRAPRGVTCQLQHPTPNQCRVTCVAYARCARCLWGGRRTTELGGRARHVALVVVGPGAKRGHCACERPLSFSARPWCSMPAAASNAKPAPRVSRSAGALLGGDSALKVAARARRAALVVFAHTLNKDAAAARGLSPSARARGVTC